MDQLVRARSRVPELADLGSEHRNLCSQHRLRQRQAPRRTCRGCAQPAACLLRARHVADALAADEVDPLVAGLPPDALHLPGEFLRCLDQLEQFQKALECAAQTGVPSATRTSRRRGRARTGGAPRRSASCRSAAPMSARLPPPPSGRPQRHPAISRARTPGARRESLASRQNSTRLLPARTRAGRRLDAMTRGITTVRPGALCGAGPSRDCRLDERRRDRRGGCRRDRDPRAHAR